MKLENQTIRFSTAEKLAWILLPVFTVVASASTSYVVNRTQIEYRLTSLERRADKSEQRADEQDKVLQKLTTDMAVCRSILEGMERERKQSNQRGAAFKEAL